jgi:hypothetical protein
MPDDKTLLMIFSGILAVAVLMQSIVFLLIYKSIRQLTVRIDNMGIDLLRNVETVSEKVNEGLTTVRNVAEDLKQITSKLTGTAEIVHKRVKEVDAFLAEATSTARLEILRIQDTVHDASRRIQETIDLLRNGIQAPLNEINAFTRAIRVAMDVLFRRRRGPSGASALDEEMFI